MKPHTKKVTFKILLDLTISRSSLSFSTSYSKEALQAKSKLFVSVTKLRLLNVTVMNRIKIKEKLQFEFSEGASSANLLNQRICQSAAFIVSTFKPVIEYSVDLFYWALFIYKLAALNMVRYQKYLMHSEMKNT